MLELQTTGKFSPAKQFYCSCSVSLDRPAVVRFVLTQNLGRAWSSAKRAEPSHKRQTPSYHGGGGRRRLGKRAAVVHHLADDRKDHVDVESEAIVRRTFEALD